MPNKRKSIQKTKLKEKTNQKSIKEEQRKSQKTETSCPCAQSKNLIEDCSNILPTNAKACIDQGDGATPCMDRNCLHTMCGGVKEEDEDFLKQCYPNLSKETYNWPLTFEFNNPSDASFALFEGANETENPENMNSRLGKYGNRKGDEAEQKTFLRMRAMLRKKKVPSFIICSYKWMEFLNLNNICSKDTLKEGDMDVLVLVPGTGVFAIEVKAKPTINDKQDARRIMKNCFKEQCMKTIQVVAKSTPDLIARKNVIFVKIASLPNCPRSDLQRFTCDSCRFHFITKDDFESTVTLSKWYEDLIHFLPKCELSLPLYGRMICRFVGPQSNVEIKLLSDVTNDIHKKLEEQGPDESGKSKWGQMNQEQWDAIKGNPRFLWLTGDPGTGKTVLAQWKIGKILRQKNDKKHVVYFMAGNKDMLFIKEMKERFGSYLIDVGKFELNIEPIENNFEETSDFNGIQGVMDVVNRLMVKHKACFLSVIIDEFWTIKNHSAIVKHSLKECTTLQNVWVIQNPSCKELPDTSDLSYFQFKTVELEEVMRMSVSNITLLKQWLGKNYDPGHAFQGPLPVLYQMKCICEQLQCVQKQICTPFLISKLTEEYVTNYQKTWPKGSKRVNISEDVVVMTRFHIKVKKLLIKKKIQVTVRPALYFTGCDKKVVIVDIMNVGDYEADLVEALTRAMGSLVLFEVSCDNDMSQNQISKYIHSLHKCTDQGVVDGPRRVTFNEAEIDMLRREIRLGLHRDEHEFQENVGSAVTGAMLLHAIAPLENDIKTISQNVSKNAEILQRIEQKFLTQS